MDHIAHWAKFYGLFMSLSHYSFCSFCLVIERRQKGTTNLTLPLLDYRPKTKRDNPPNLPFAYCSKNVPLATKYPKRVLLCTCWPQINPRAQLLKKSRKPQSLDYHVPRSLFIFLFFFFWIVNSYMNIYLMLDMKSLVKDERTLEMKARLCSFETYWIFLT